VPKGLFVYLIILDKLLFFTSSWFVFTESSTSGSKTFFLLPAPLGSKYLSYGAVLKIKRLQLTDKSYFVVN